MFTSPWIRKPDFHNIKDIDYDDYWNYRGWQLNKKLKPREQIMLDIIPIGAKIADIGCGNSLLPVKVKEKGCDVKVADISKIVLDQYRTLGIDGFEIDIEKVNNIKLSDKFDYLILSEVLEHTRNPEQTVKALKPYTKYFLITVPNSASYQFRYGLMFRGRFFTQWVYHPSEHLRYWSHIDFLDWLEAMGLEVISTPVSDGFSFRGLLPWLPRLWKNLLGFRMVYYCRVK
ncbi:MAG: methionine biosynthesis protein MetW [Candidatus Paceibacterota bacterium]|jgi:2-polyprenyl-3-methyl-5-hydroxy-6-metoxy-1,4-benzoquinol methylase